MIVVHYMGQELLILTISNVSVLGHSVHYSDVRGKHHF